jgi:hypothetical protein
MSDLNAIMAHGELVSIFSLEECDIITNRMRSNKGNVSLGNENTSRHLQDFRE